MKKKILQQKLLKSLLNSDFLFIERKNRKQSQAGRYLNLSTSFLKNQSLVYLDVFELIKDFKQILRLISFIKKQSGNKDLNFFLKEEKNYYDVLIDNFLQVDKIKNSFSIDIDSHRVTSPKVPKKAVHLGFLVDNLLSSSSDKNFFRNQFYKNIFLFISINSEIESNTIGYSIYNNMSDYKKILFFLSFLRQVLTQYALPKKI